MTLKVIKQPTLEDLFNMFKLIEIILTKYITTEQLNSAKEDLKKIGFQVK